MFRARLYKIRGKENPTPGADVFYGVGALGGSIIIDGVGKDIHGVHGAAAPLHGIDIGLSDGKGDYIPSIISQ